MTIKPETNLRDCVRMTIQPDINTKKRAEHELEELSRRPEFLSDLLVLSESDTEPSVRMFSAVYFRRYLEKFWRVEEFDRASIIKQLPMIILSSSKEGKKQLLAALQYVLKSEEAEHWAPIMKKAEEFVGSADSSTVMTGLKILNKLVIAFIEEYKAEKEFETILDNTGETILNIIVSTTKAGNGAMAAFAMKVLGHSCESYMLPNVFKQPVFIQNLVSVVDLCINTLFETPSAVKWSLIVVNGLLKKSRKKKDLPAFGIFERADVLGLLYKKAIDILSLYRRTGLSQKVEALSFDLLKNILSKPEGWALAKNDIPMITTSFILPAVSFTEELEEVWESCQIDFMRENEARYLKNASTVASELFLDIAKKSSNTDKELLAYLFNMIIQKISPYPNSHTPEIVRLRYGGLVLFKIAGKYIRKNDAVFSIVMSDIKAPHSFIQYMAFSTLHHFSYYGDLPESVLEPFMAAVRSKDIGVMVESVLCLPSILSIPEMKEKLLPSIPGFINLLLELSNKVQIEVLSTALEDTIMMCTDESISIAPGIAEAISNSIVMLLKEGGDEEQNNDEPEERYEVIDGYLRTIITLIESMHKSPEGVINIMVPIKKMIVTVGTSFPDFFPDLFSLIVVSTYTMKTVDGMYEVLDVILKLPIDDLAIYINELSGVFDNYITYGKEHMIKYIQPIFSVLTEMMQGIITDYDFPYLCRIIESILLNAAQMLGDKLGDFIKASVNLVLSDKDMFTSPSPLISAVEIVLCSVIIMPGETIRILLETNKLEFIITSLQSTYKKFERVHDLKLLLLFTGVLISQPEKSLPAEIPPYLLMKIFIFAIESFPSALARREALKNEVDDIDYQENDSYGEPECFEEDPTFETPLDAIDPFDYARNICSLGSGTIIAGLWGSLPVSDRQKIVQLIQPRQ